MSVLSGVTQVEQRALLSAAEEARIGRVYMVEEGLAAAIGAGVPVDDPHASAVVDIGGGTTNIAAIVNGAIIASRAERIGSSDIDAAIMDRLRRHRGLTIGILNGRTAQAGTEFRNGAKRPQLEKWKYADVTYRPEVRAPWTSRAAEVYAVTQPIIRRIAEEVRSTLTELPGGGCRRYLRPGINPDRRRSLIGWSRSISAEGNRPVCSCR